MKDNKTSIRYKKQALPPPIPCNEIQPSAMRDFNSHKSDIRNKNDMDRDADRLFEDKINRNISNNIWYDYF